MTEYPKMLYKSESSYRIVYSESEEKTSRKDGFVDYVEIVNPKPKKKRNTTEAIDDGNSELHTATDGDSELVASD